MNPQDTLAKALKDLSNAMTAAVSAWIDAEGDDRHGHPTDIGDYPFSCSLDEMDEMVAYFSRRAATWAAAVAHKREEHQAAQEALADRHGIDYDANGPDIEACPECGEMAQYYGPDAHYCHSMRCEDRAAADFEDRAYGRDY